MCKVEHTGRKSRSQVKQSTITFDMGINCNTKDDSIRKLFIWENYLINSRMPKFHYICLLCELEQAIYPLEV